MNHPVDNLFNDALSQHVETPPAGAWARVEANLSKKNNRVVWFRWAAALLIPALLTGAIVWLNHHAEEKNVNKLASKDNAIQVKRPTAIAKQPAISDKTRVADPEEASAKASRANVPPTRPDHRAEEKTESPSVVRSATSDLEEIKKIPSAENNDATFHDVAASDAVTNQQSVASTAPVFEKPVVLEYTLESPDAPAAPVEKPITVTIELKERNRIQKAFDFARDAKNSEGPFATLRDVKDDLLAFNFKKDKTKNK